MKEENKQKGAIAQLVERPLSKVLVVGSSPTCAL